MAVEEEEDDDEGQPRAACEDGLSRADGSARSASIALSGNGTPC